MKANDWDELDRRLSAIENGVTRSRRSRWDRFFVPLIAWLAAIASAVLTAWFTNQFAGAAKDAETRAEILAKNELDLYSQIAVLREKIFVGFERFTKTQGVYDPATEEASKTLQTVLETRTETLPSDVAAALRELNHYVNARKAELSALPRQQWSQKIGGFMEEATARNEKARTETLRWFPLLKGK
jgi:hypothetical protein